MTFYTAESKDQDSGLRRTRPRVVRRRRLAPQVVQDGQRFLDAIQTPSWRTFLWSSAARVKPSPN